MRKPADHARIRARQHLGRCIALARDLAGLPQAAVAERLGVTRATVIAWEGGATEPPSIDLQRLADLYHLTLDQLTGRAPLPPPEREDA